MASTQNQGIQTLLDAEKDAQKVVDEARRYRVQKLKDARSEAEKEIEEYKALKEKEFKAFEQSRAGTTQTSQSAIDKETEVKLTEIMQSYEAHEAEVVKKLIDRVTLVKPELHRNLKKIESP
ncbi:V-type ATPase [Fomitiporia mediterranea MF3/22]|uniref:V-type ATPase n=1 Tax=Fomitiporia mediterranea (strain MF3/22) TaxID=694068 RepID=UPI0004407BB7|nr:V-type ATPase [Fomitiporia mediterranea MF3/22]EJD07615.1 V-type ATPase [Fomitiporia mediterranea MF3/22]